MCLIQADLFQLRVIYRGYIRSCHAISCYQILAVSAVSWSANSVRSCFLTTQLQLLRSPTAPPTPPNLPVPRNNSPQHEPRLPAPEVYAGDPNLCRAFLTKCSLFFSLQPQTFATETSKVALVLTLLSGKAALWGTEVWENCRPCCSSFCSLSQEMRRVFDRAWRARGSAHAG